MSNQYCVNCGDRFAGTGDLCPDCLPTTRHKTKPLPESTVHNPQSTVLAQDAHCPHCGQSIGWHNVGRYTCRPAPNQVEVAYYCPVCRTLLEFACWTDE